MKLYLRWAWDGWWNDLKDCDNIRMTHFASLCRARSKDGIIVYQIICGPLRLVLGRTNQPINP